MAKLNMSAKHVKKYKPSTLKAAFKRKISHQKLNANSPRIIKGRETSEMGWK